MYQTFKTIIKHTAIYSTSDLLAKAVGFFLLPIYTRYLSPADYGILELLAVTLNIVIILVQQGMHSSFFRAYSFDYKDKEEDQKSIVSTSYLYLLFSSFIFLGGISLFSRPINNLLFQSKDYTLLVRLTFLTGFFNTLSNIPFQLFRAKLQSVKFSLVSILRFLLNVSFNIYFILKLKLGLSGVIYGNLCTAVLISILMFILIWKHLSFKISWLKLKGMLSYGLPLVPGALSFWVLTVADRYLLERLSSTTELGLYSLGIRFSGILEFLLIQPFLTTWPSIYFPLAKEKDAQATFSRLTTYFLLIGCFFSLGIIAISNPAIKVMADSKFWGAYKVIPLLVFSTLLYGLFGITIIGIFIQNKTKYNPLIIGIAAAFNVLLNFLLIPPYGMLGAAFSIFFSYLLMNLLAYLINLRIYPIPYEWIRILKIVLVTALFLFALDRIQVSSWKKELFFKMAVLLLFPLALWITAFFAPGELKKAKDFILELFEKLKLKRVYRLIFNKR
jgi:O-antigen/teichoic acid export membrane protein